MSVFVFFVLVFVFLCWRGEEISIGVQKPRLCFGLRNFFSLVVNGITGDFLERGEGAADEWVVCYGMVCLERIHHHHNVKLFLHPFKFFNFSIHNPTFSFSFSPSFFVRS